MKKLFNKFEKETLWGGLFGVIAIVAIFFEMLFGSLESTAIAGGIKDIAGTIVDVMVFAFAAKMIFVKEDTTFDATFAREMEKIENKYKPLLKKAEDNGDERRAKKFKTNLCYELATNIEALLDGAPQRRALFFELKLSAPDKISFFINKTTFVGQSPEDFEPIKEKIALKIETGILKRFPEFKDGVSKTSNGIEVAFGKELKSADDAMLLAKLVDCVLLLYIAVCKK